MDLQQALAREKQHAERCGEERDDAVHKCRELLRELKETSVSTGAELQGILIDDKMATLEKEHERSSEIIELTRQHNDRLEDLQNQVREAEEALEESKEVQFQEIAELNRSKQVSLVSHHSEAFVATLSELEIAVDISNKRAERAEAALEQYLVTSPPSELNSWKGRAIAAETESVKQEDRLQEMMSQLEEFKTSQTWAESEILGKLEDAQKRASMVRESNMREGEEMRDAHKKVVR